MSTEHDRLTETLATLRSLVAFDIRTLFDDRGSLLPAQLWPSEASLAITSIVSRELFQDGRLVGVEHRAKFSDRVRALELSLKELGALVEREPPPTDPDEMSDAELAARIRELHGPTGPHSWEAAEPERIDADMRSLISAYRLLRPDVVIDAKNPPEKATAMRGARLALPAPDAAPEEEAAPGEPAEVPDEPGLPLDMPEHRRDRELTYDEQVKRGINIVPYIGGAPSIPGFWGRRR
jgi:hypothetical protein